MLLVGLLSIDTADEVFVALNYRPIYENQETDEANKSKHTFKGIETLEVV